MQKSMVHELNPFVTSTVQYGRSSFIHTTHQTDFNQLRKQFFTDQRSRIQNLPNYRKQDLSGKLNFVVVFQAIQIERLSLEIQTLRIKLKDYQRQLCNYENYQVQIRELTQRCHSYEIQRQDHQEAMQKMHKICQQLYNELEQMRARYADIDLGLKEKYRVEKQRGDMLSAEIEKWRMRCQAIETSKARQMEDMRLQLETQRKSMLQRQIRELSLKYESERSMLEQQLKKQRQMNESTRGQLNRIRQQLQQSRIRQEQLRQYEQRLDEYEDKLMLMAQENMRLNEMIRIKKEEIENLKNNQRNLIIKLESFNKIEQELAMKDKRLQQLETDIRQWAQNYSRLEADNSRNLILAAKAQQYQRLLDSSAQEMERMNTIIRQKISEIDKLKSYSQKLSIELEQTKKVTDKVQQFQNQIQNAQNENDKLNEQLKSRLQELQSWKTKFTEIQNKLPLLAQTQNQCKSLKQKLAAEGAAKGKLSETITLLQKDLSKAAQMQQNLNKQRQQNKDLQKQIQRLNNTIRNISSQNSDFVKKVGQLQSRLREKKDLLDELQKCKKTINMMTKELDRINGLIHEKLQEIKQLRENYNTFNTNTIRYKQIEEQFMANLQQTQKLVLKIDQYRRENELLSEKLFNLQNKVKKLESEAYNSNEEKERLISIVNQKKVQLQDLMGRIQKLDEKISQLTIIEQQHQRLKTTYAQLQQRLKETENKLSKEVNRSGELTKEVEKMTSENMRLKTESNLTKQFISEFLAIKEQSEQKDQLIRGLLKRIQTIEKCLMMVKKQSMINSNLGAEHGQRWENINQRFQILSEWMDRFLKLQERIDELREENLKLTGDVNMMSISLAESQYASQSSYQRLQEQQQSSRVRDDDQYSNPSYITKTTTTTRTVLSPLTISSTSNSNKQTYSQQSQQQQAYNHSPGTRLSTIEEDWGREGSDIHNSRGYYGDKVGRNWEMDGVGSSYSNNQTNNYKYGNNNNKYGNNNKQNQKQKDYYESQVREFHSSSSTTNLGLNPSGLGSSSLYGSSITGSKGQSPFSLYQEQPTSLRPSSSNIGNSNGEFSSGSVIQTRILRPNSSQQKVYTYTSTVNSPKYSQQNSNSSYINTPTNSYANSSTYINNPTNSTYRAVNTSNQYQSSYSNTNTNRQPNFIKQSSTTTYTSDVRPNSPQLLQGQFTRKNAKSPLNYL